MKIDNKTVTIYGKENNGSPLIILNTFNGNGSSVYKQLCNIVDKPFTLAVIGDIKWDLEMTPWEAPPAFKGETPYLGGADTYIEKLEKIFIPKILNELSIKPEYLAIAGYSLGGLFAIYSMYKTDMFSRAASASGSMWFPGFADFIENNEPVRMPDRLYFSLGDKESKTKNEFLKSVDENTIRIVEYFRRIGIETAYESNPGNHFKDADLRMAKAIAGIL